ncbi:single-stranded DNA-binding protein [Mycobacteroides chelonae]|uniref:single-stranded DNA-binding protein n=1 Tax=Mycobacteroides chelonae TaxID=1774 RepID=UPI0008A95CD1|nr:single-stranded DNA-binding protein [Mycobacteroides chelonae]OHT47943.1 hypothetical protein BKG63_24290 [Mycobacteroides chelonae]OHT93541.1 hypothetical protein BKG71_23560 [Mycobacteroides chelonae]OHT99588.1 hypothetical protein BKG72_03960 [Mycobacteroides chelonae]OLT92950.1 hypothetical protein BKG59_05845 [Mycobacteroides chelonae]
MSEATQQFIGRLGKEVDLKFSNNGKALGYFSLAHTPRKYDKDRDEWSDAGETTWLPVKCFGKVAEGAADALAKGDEVIAVGKLRTESWDDKKTGEKVTRLFLIADFVGRSVVGKGGSKPANDSWGANDSDAPF